jgi:5-formyltetrahydrofolate cyclo-ligase
MDKQAVRDRVWNDLADSGTARFPFPPHGRIPNFAGADAATDRLASTDAWQSAAVVKANPDAPQLPARRRALRDGRRVYMAVPRLRDEHPFYLLDPTELADIEAAATVSHVDEHAAQVAPAAVDPVELVLVGSVAVTEAGARIGKGEGYSDLEFGLLAEAGLVDDRTTVATTVHERQVVDGPLGVAAHDVPLDLVMTPERLIRTATPHDQPEGIDWSLLTEERLTEMPVLERLRDSG